MSLLKKKISAAQTQDKSEYGTFENLTAIFKPMSDALGETLNTSTSTDFEPKALETSPAPAALKDEVLVQPSVKMAISCAQSGLKGLGIISPALSSLMTQALLHVSEESDPEAGYIPTKLDTFLLSKFSRNIVNELSKGLRLETALSIELFPNVESMGLSKPEIEGLSELTQMIFSFDQANVEKNKPKTPSPYYISIFWPKNQLLELSKLTDDIEDVQTIHLDTDNPWTQHMRSSVKTAEIPIRAVVESCHMTIAECTRFVIGQVISLPGVSLNSVGLIIDLETELETQSPQIEISRGSLGIFKKNRALKLTENIDAQFFENTDWMTL